MLFSLQPIPAVDLFSNSRKKSLESKSYPLEIYQCDSCHLIQVVESPPANIFYDNYIYTSSSSTDMEENFKSLASEIDKIFCDRSNIKLLDIGCNDGLFLSNFSNNSRYKLFGVDPSPVARSSTNPSYQLFSEYFPGQNTISGGPYDVIVGTNSLAHIPNIGDSFKSISNILSDDGILIIEVSDFLRMVEKGAWDYIYHEHLYYYTASTIKSILENYNLEVFRIDEIPTKGGSIRVFAKKVAAKCSAIKSYSNDIKLISIMKEKYYAQLQFYDNLYSKYENSKIYGYGACATGTVAICQHKLFGKLQSIIDDNPSRHGLYSPYFGYEVSSLESTSFSKGDLVVVFAWRFIDQIRSRIIES